MNTILLQKLFSFTKKTTATTFIGSVVLLCMLVFSNTTQAQVATNYGFSEQGITPAYADLPSNTKTQLITGIWTNAVVNTPIGFTFTFNGSNYTNTNVSANGFITFGATAPAVVTAKPISSSEAYAGTISAFGSDLEVITNYDDPLFPGNQGNSVSKMLTGSSPNQILKIEYRLVRRTPTTTSLMSFQIWLYQTTNVIEIHYDVASHNANVPGEVGLRGLTNTDYNNRSWATGNWPTLPTTTPAGTANTSFMLLRASTTIPVGANRTFRWTPVNCSTPLTPNYTNLLSSSVSLTWGVPAPVPTQYNYEVRTSGAGGSGAAGLTTSGTVAASPANATGLAPGTTYTAYVRSDCGAGGQSAWVACGTFTTLCAPTTVPYTRYIEEGMDVIVPGIPTCMTRQNAGTGNQWVTTPQVGAGFFDEHLIYNFHPTNAANAWVYSQGISMTAGTTYRLSYLYGGSSQFTFITNKMKVMYGAVPQASSMTTLLDDHPTIKTSAFTNVVNFTAPSTGVFYFGFQAYSAANNGELYLDDIEIFTSTCRQPTGVTIPPALVTFNSALVTWTAPTPAPTGGYAYYLSTSPTPPGNSTPPTGVLPAGTTITTLNSLTPSTTYYFWVRGNCGFGEFSEWSTSGTFTTSVAPPAYCIPSGAGFAQDPNGITNVTMGSINNTTGLELPNYYGNYSGLTTNVAQGATVPVSITFRTGWTYNTKIWIDWNNNGSFLDAGEEVYSGTSAAPNPSTLAASFTVPGAQPLGSRRMRIGSTDSVFGTPTIPTPCRTGNYMAYEDYTINVIVAPPALTLNIATSTQCGNTNSPLVTITTPLANFDVYTWSPATGVTGTPATGYTFNSGTTITYILTGSQTSGAFSTNTTTFKYVANDTPTPITIATPSGTVACQSGPPIPLNASGGVVSNITIFSEDFNSGFPATWTSTNASVNGTNTANPAWTVQPNNHNTGYIWGTTISSNDASSFIISNSDAQGNLVPGSQTRTTLTSAPIDLTIGYTAASLSFWHYFRYIGSNDFAYVQVSTTGAGGPYTNLIQYTNTQGAPTNFTQAIINLNPYLGQTIHIRFNYQSNWGWGWAVDNFKVSGSATSAITWTPIAGLFNDAAGSSPYVLNTGANTVYAMPSAATTYTASASTPGPTVCSSTQTVSVTVTPVAIGTLAPLNQSACEVSGFVDIVMSGHAGNVIRWEYADNAAFTLGVMPIANTTTMLPVASFGVFATTRFFRAVVGNGTCNNLFTAAAQVSYPTTTWNGTLWSNGTPDATKKVIYNFVGSLNVTTPLAACSLQIISGNVNVTSTGSFTVTGAVTVSGGSLNFANNASLVQINNVANTGTISYVRNAQPMFKYDYTYWSSPVAAQEFTAFSPFTMLDKYFRWNTAIYNWSTIYAFTFPGPYTTTMTPGLGYIMRAPDGGVPVFTLGTRQTFVGTFTGVPNNGDVSAPIVTAGINKDNLLGNPYPSAIDIDMFIRDTYNDSRIEGTIYLWTHNTPITAMAYNAADFATYNLAGAVGTGGGSAAPGFNATVPGRYVGAGQSFMIEGSVASGNVFFRNTMRSLNNSQFYRNGQEPYRDYVGETNRVWLQISNASQVYKEALVGYFEFATQGYDRGYDGKMINPNTPVNLYSLLDNYKLSIQGRALPFDVNDIVPLGYSTSQTGTLTIKKGEVDGLFEHQDVYLEDKALNIIHDLSTSDYTFVSDAGIFNERFNLRYTNTILGVSDADFTDNAVIVYKKENSIYVETTNIAMESVKIFDTRGRLIKVNNNINDTTTSFKDIHIAQQVLLIHITDVNGTVVTKKIVY